jgi:cyclopropane-fatty-acyl-phospholipid synthase
MTAAHDLPSLPYHLRRDIAPGGPLLIDASRWPDVAALPARNHRSIVARQLFRRGVTALPIRIELPGGRSLGSGGAHAPLMQIVRPDSFDRRVGASGLIGFGEAYMAGDWEADDLSAVLTAFAHRASTIISPRLQRFRTLATRSQPDSQRATKANSRQQISHHYDLSNDLFATFLDPSLSYSSALFEGSAEHPARARWEDLHAAQHRKIDRLLDAIGVRAGTSLLEIGSGWGELAIRAAQRGAHVRTLTLSTEQKELAEQRIANAGLSERIEVVLQDYRDAERPEGGYDAIVSVEMIEAVGYDFWPAYFQGLERLLAPDGRIGLQAITMPHDRLEASKSTFTWIQKYIFPGGLIPSETAMTQVMDRHTSLRVVDRLAFGQHYAETLRLWRERFEHATPEVDAQGFDRVFRRMWSLYLAYSEAGFRAGYLNVVQIVLQAGRDR